MPTYDAVFRESARSAIVSPRTWAATVDKRTRGVTIIKMVLLALATVAVVGYAVWQIVLVEEQLTIWRQFAEVNDTLAWPAIMMCPGSRREGGSLDKISVINCTATSNDQVNSPCYWRSYEDERGGYSCLNFNWNGTAFADDANGSRLTLYLKATSPLPSFEWTQIILYDAAEGWNAGMTPLFYLSTVDRSSSLIVVSRTLTRFRNGTETVDISGIPSTIYHPLCTLSLFSFGTIASASSCSAWG